MQTQAKVQLDERDKNPGIVRPPFNPLQVLNPFKSKFDSELLNAVALMRTSMNSCSDENFNEFNCWLVALLGPCSPEFWPRWEARTFQVAQTPSHRIVYLGNMNSEFENLSDLKCSSSS